MKDYERERVCVSLGGLSSEETIRVISDLKMAEIRIDLMKLSVEEVGGIFSSSTNLVATCRPGGIEDNKRLEFLITAIENGASYVDLEINSSRKYRETVVKKAREVGCKIIVSYHNQSVTPSDVELENIVRECRDTGADIVKIACRANSYSDSARLLGLLGHEKNLIVIGMGEKGKITRIVAPLLGSPFTYASIAGGFETADGQIEAEKLKKLMEALS